MNAENTTDRPPSLSHQERRVARANKVVQLVERAVSDYMGEPPAYLGSFANATPEDTAARQQAREVRKEYFAKLNQRVDRVITLYCAMLQAEAIGDTGAP